MERLLGRLVPAANDEEVRDAVREGVSDPEISRVLGLQPQTPGLLSAREMVFIHALVLLARPAVVVETGVAHGSSSVAILSALRKIGSGRLYSIDLPMVEREGTIESPEGACDVGREETTLVAAYDRVGWLIPEALRDRWELHLGDSLRVLPDLLSRLDQVDLFLHDSLHRYAHMRGEFEIVWPRLSDGGILLADDIFVFHHAAIADFARSAGVRFRTYFGMGVMQKPGRRKTGDGRGEKGT
ncbi:MAG: class I SAM-dependent methyltransferase [Nitrospirae bacterium]|nr:class I SAM-dependent methyltransferase [Nitrospirota bacterium]